jgi:FkbM family methyltransferase
MKSSSMPIPDSASPATFDAAAEGAGWLDGALLAYGRAWEHPAKIRIIRWLVRRFAAGRVRVRYGTGAIIEIDPSDYIGWAIFKTSHYEPASLRLALQIMHGEPGLFVDVGANFGWYTCAVGTLTGSAVVSIEPDCGNCVSLRRNIALNRLQNTVVFNGAVGAELAAVQISKRAPANSGTVAIVLAHQASGRSEDWVATIPLEALLKQVLSPSARPVLIKVDVEGFERQVLTGLDFDGPFRPKNILLEFDRQLSTQSWESFDVFRSFFTARRYELLDVFGNRLRGAEAIPEDNVWARDAGIG